MIRFCALPKLTLLLLTIFGFIYYDSVGLEKLSSPKCFEGVTYSRMQAFAAAAFLGEDISKHMTCDELRSMNREGSSNMISMRILIS